MNTNNITNYKPKDFAELLGVSIKTLQPAKLKKLEKQLKKRTASSIEEIRRLKETQ